MEGASANLTSLYVSFYCLCKVANCDSFWKEVWLYDGDLRSIDCVSDDLIWWSVHSMNFNLAKSLPANLLTKVPSNVLVCSNKWSGGKFQFYFWRHLCCVHKVEQGAFNPPLDTLDVLVLLIQLDRIISFIFGVYAGKDSTGILVYD